MAGLSRQAKPVGPPEAVAMRINRGLSPISGVLIVGGLPRGLSRRASMAMQDLARFPL